jgi:hypothetical protein
MDPSPPRPEPAPSALPSVGVRLLSFLLIVVAGAAGGFIGFSFVDLQCEGDCTVPNGLGALTGALIGAVGVAIVTVLALRAMGEWRTIRPRHEPPAPGSTRVR